MKTWQLMALISAGCFALVVLSALFDYGGKTMDVVANEIDPHVIQERYVHFQQLKAAIDNSDSTIESMITAAIVKKPAGDREKWDRTDKQLFASSVDDISGQIANRNNLIAEYNGDMSMWNKRIANIGSWPQGSKTKEDFQNDFPSSYPQYDYGDRMRVLLY